VTYIQNKNNSVKDFLWEMMYIILMELHLSKEDGVKSGEQERRKIWCVKLGS